MPDTSDGEPITPQVPETDAAVTTPEVSTDYPRNLSVREQLKRQWPSASWEKR